MEKKNKRRQPSSSSSSSSPSLSTFSHLGSEERPFRKLEEEHYEVDKLSGSIAPTKPVVRRTGSLSQEFVFRSLSLDGYLPLKRFRATDKSEPVVSKRWKEIDMKELDEEAAGARGGGGGREEQRRRGTTELGASTGEEEGDGAMGDSLGAEPARGDEEGSEATTHNILMDTNDVKNQGKKSWNSHRFRVMGKQVLFVAGFLSVQAMTQTITALSSPEWIVITLDDDSEQVVNKAATEYILLCLSLTSEVLFVLSMLFHFFSARLHLSNWMMAVFSAFGTIFLFSLVVEFSIKVNETARLRFGKAFAHTVAAFVCSALAFLLELIGRFYFKAFELTGRTRRLLLAITVVCLYVPLGGVMFSEIEGWDFDDAKEFCLVTITTIGYGTLVPTTTGGQIAMIFYTIFGIGVIITLFSLARDTFIDKIRSLARYPRGKKESGFGDLEHESSWKVNIIMLIFGLALWFLSALGFSQLEGWTYMEATYFCFVTMSTVGYGDLVPKTAGGKFLLIWFIYISLAIFAFVVTIFGNYVISVSDRLMAKADAKKGTIRKPPGANESALQEECKQLVSLAQQLAECVDEEESSRLMLQYSQVCDAILQGAKDRRNGGGGLLFESS